MRRLAFLVMAAGLPVGALAQEAVIRIEAKRDAEASEAAARWASQFDEVVTFPCRAAGRPSGSVPCRPRRLPRRSGR
ncbi:hypothetical protein ACFSYD_14820 [Paracoccus aerius]